MKRLLLDGPELRRDIPPAPVTRAEPVVRLRSGLTLDDCSCWQYPTMLVGSVGSGKSTLLDQIQQPVLAHAAKAGDTVVIFAAKPDVLRYRRPGDPVISVSASDPGSRWDIFAELNHAANPMLMLREISSSLFAEQRKQSTQVFFPDAAQELFYQSARFMFEAGQKKKIHISNAELIDFLTHTPINGKDGWIDLADRYPAYFSCVRDFIGEGSTQGQGVLSELRTMISKVFIESFATNNGMFSGIGAIRQGGKRVFLLYEPDKARTALPLYKLILDLMMQQSLDAALRHKTWFILDEFSLLPQQDCLLDVLSFGRDPSGSGQAGVRVIAAIQSAQLLTHHYTATEAKTLLSLFPNLITFRVMDSLSREVFSDRYGTAQVQYRHMGENGTPVSTNAEEKVISDAVFSKLLTKPGQAFMSLPGVCSEPFYYDGWRP